MEVPAPVKPAKPAKQRPAEYDVVLPGYSTESSAQAEMKALELLGFRVKDAIIEKNEGSGYRVRLARVRTRNNADDLAASLARMSFRAVVEVVQR
jgi:cell division protein FtsN